MRFEFLLLSRVFRSIGIIFITLSSSLYLSLLGFSPAQIGLIFLGAIGVTAVLSLSLGMFGDRKGYKKSLILGDLTGVIAGVLLWHFSLPSLAAIAFIIGGVGGAAGGMRGAFSTGLTPLVASNWVDEEERVRKMSLLISTASFAGIGGSILLSLVSVVGKNVIDGYRLFFGISAFLMIASIACISLVKEVERPKKTTKIMQKSSAKYIGKVILSNSLAGVGLGMAIPLLPLWYKLAFHVGSFEIGIVFTISYISTGIGSLIAGKIHINPLKVASLTRALNGIFLLAMALSPFFGLAALLYIIRGLNAGIGSPNRTMVNIRGVQSEDYGTASSVQGIATRVSQMSSGLGGFLMEYALPLPLEVGGVLQAIGGYLYYWLLGERGQEDAKKVDEGEKRKPTRTLGKN
ncbi:MFS transporter [Candidatus Acidianus copahuensis]|nr:MFS transporter [Candidatus Acidianus copahuensis]